VLEVLLPAMRGTAPLRRLSLDADACFTLPSGLTVPAGLLASQAGQQQLQAAGAAGWLEVQECDSKDTHLPSAALDIALGRPIQAARRVVITSTAAGF